MWMTVLQSHEITSMTNTRFMKTGFFVAPFVILSACTLMCLQLGVFPHSLLY